MKFLEIMESALDQNIDCDADGNVDGKWFAIEQIIRDMRNSRIKIVDRNGRPYDLARAIEFARKNQ